MEHQHIPAKNKRSTPIFVLAALDDYGLTPIEFRVYGRIARREDHGRNGRPCYESIPNMAGELSVSPKTVTRALQVLAATGLVTETPRNGFTTERRLAPVENWKPKSELTGIREKVYKQKRSTPDISAGGSAISTRNVRCAPVPPLQPGEGRSPVTGVLPTPRQVEGYTSEGIPKEGNPIKAIPHTRGAVIVEDTGDNEQDRVCVPVIEMDRLYEEYAHANVKSVGGSLNNPTGWLVRAKTQRDIYDPIVLHWKREREEETERRAADEAREQAELLRKEVFAKEAEAKRAEEEARRRRREIEEASERDHARQMAEAAHERREAEAAAEAEEFKRRIRERAQQRKSTYMERETRDSQFAVS